MPFLKDLTPQAFNELSRRMVSSQPLGLTTGIDELDELLGGGLSRQESTLLIGDTSIGKSWLLLWLLIAGIEWIRTHLGERITSGYVLPDDVTPDSWRHDVKNKKGKHPIVVFWSLEMSAMLVFNRIIQMIASLRHKQYINTRRLMSGKMRDYILSDSGKETVSILGNVRRELEQEYGPYLYLEFGARSIPEFRRVLQRLAKEYDITLIAIDYFRLIRIDEAYSEANEQAVKSAALQELKQDFDAHVLCIVDVTKAGQMREYLEQYDIRGGAAAQYDADMIAVLRPHKDQNEDGYRSRLTFDLTKSRQSPTGKLDLTLDKSTGILEVLSRRTNRYTLLGGVKD